MNLNYSTYVTVILDIKNFINAGITKEEIRQVINGIPDPSRLNSTLLANPYRFGDSGTWQFVVQEDWAVCVVVQNIENKLNRLLQGKETPKAVCGDSGCHGTDCWECAAIRGGDKEDV